MFMVWTGWGILVPVLTVAVFFAAMSSLESLQLVEAYESFWVSLWFTALAAALFFLGRKLNDSSNDKVLVDPETGEQHLHKIRHTFFWIPIQWWSAVVAVMICLFYLTQFLEQIHVL